MMNIQKAKIVTGLDIGSSKISAVAASISKDGRFDIIGHATRDSRGVSRGVIIDLNEAVQSTASVLKKLKSKLPSGLGGIYVNMTGEALKGSGSSGMIPISVRGREITVTDMARCVDAGSTIHLPFDREIIHRIVQRFSVDDQPWIKSPLGLYASRLACEVYIITAAVNNMQDIYKCVSNAGYDAKEIVYTGLADATAVLNKEEKAAGVLLLSIGAQLTEMSVFFDGTLCGIDILSSGAEDFKGDFRASPVFDGIIAKVASKMKHFSDSGNKLQSIVVTGGIIFSDGVIEYMEEKLACPVRMGVAKDVRGDISGLDSIRLCTAIGLAKYAAASYEEKVRRDKDLMGRVSSAVVDIFNNYF